MTAIMIVLIYHYLLISIVLYKPVEREDLEAGDVKDPDEDGFFLVDDMISTILLIYPHMSSPLTTHWVISQIPKWMSVWEFPRWHILLVKGVAVLHLDKIQVLHIKQQPKHSSTLHLTLHFLNLLSPRKRVKSACLCNIHNETITTGTFLCSLKVSWSTRLCPHIFTIFHY